MALDTRRLMGGCRIATAISSKNKVDEVI